MWGKKRERNHYSDKSLSSIAKLELKNRDYSTALQSSAISIIWDINTAMLLVPDVKFGLQ